MVAALLLAAVSFANAFLSPNYHPTTIKKSHTILHNSLKPAALPLLDAGKALARSGELLIDLTTALDLYGGSLSSTGAQIRNAGDSVAQAAASCRFKTGAELVTDELREAATCLAEGVVQAKRAVEEAGVDESKELQVAIQAMVEPLQCTADSLEASGARILQRATPLQVGMELSKAGVSLGVLAGALRQLSPNKEEAQTGAQRMTYASEQMILAGNNLQGIKSKAAPGKSWLKGGGNL